MKNELYSVNNSSESFEKSIGIMYTNLQINHSFYDQYHVNVWYGNNLPKASSGLNVNGTTTISGTIGFYEKYMSDCDFGVTFNINELWLNKNNVLEDLVNRNIISSRNAEKLKNDYSLFVRIISLLPVTYLYPEFYANFLKQAKPILTNISFKHIDLFESYEKIINDIQANCSLYKIYALQGNGTIGTFNFDLPDNIYYERNKIHLIKSISKSLVISGNSAVFLTQIKNDIDNYKGILGYRIHKEYRVARQVAFDNLANDFSLKVVEPKNTLYNSYFDKYSSIDNIEQRANEVAAESFHDFVKSNAYTLKF